KEVDFSTRLQRVLMGFSFLLLMIVTIVLLTSRHPIRDSISLFFATAIFCFLFFILPSLKTVSEISLTEDLVEIKGRFLNKIYCDSIKLKDLKLSVNALGKGIISGYELDIRTNKKKYLLSPNNGWETNEIYKILVDIKAIRARYKINREDGTYDIPEIKRFLDEKEEY
ncbi:MAG: hypothetical protein ACK457_11545, partial [Flavobacteriia bacterium]